MGSADEVGPDLAQALMQQFALRQAALRGGAYHVGWKLGIGDRERLGADVVVGHLTSASVLQPGGHWHVSGEPDLRADVELAVQLSGQPRRADAAAVVEVIAATATAIEIVDLSGNDDGFTVVASNVFHRAVAFGEFQPGTPGPGQATLTVNGQQRASDSLRDGMLIAGRVAAASRILSALGHPLRAGDRIITGNIVQVPIRAGDTVTAEIAGLGSVSLMVICG